MPFSWYYPDVPTSYTDAKAKASSMYEREMAERAALLLRLGFSKSETRDRIKGNVEWDFELHAKPAHFKRVNTLVNEVFARRGTGSGAPTL